MGVSAAQGSAGLKPGVCTSTTRPSNPFEGQMIYETDTDLTYIYGGTAWQQVSGGTAVGNSGLVYVTEATIGSAVSSVTVSSAFSSTYDNYRIKITGMTGSAAADTSFQFGGITTSVYAYSGFYQAIGVGTSTTFGGTATTMPIGTMAATLNTQINIEISGANLAVAKYFEIATTSNNIRVNQGGQCNSAVQATAFTITPASGTLTGGTITVYGYRKA